MFFDGAVYEDELDMGPHVAMPSLSGDFYHEPDDVTRGLSLYSDAGDYGQIDDTWKHAAFGFSELDEFVRHGDAPLLGKAHIGDTETSWRDPANEHRRDLPMSRFQDCNEAPHVPVDTFFQLEQTTIVVNHVSAAQIGNCMLDFMGSEATGFITKINPVKFTIKADMALDGCFFATKVRIYRQAFGQYAIEMQRRSGDSVAFLKFYRCASQYVDSCINSDDLARTTELEAPTFEQAPFPVDAGVEASAAPLLDLAESCNPELQAEAVQGLSQLAKDPNMALELCSSQALMVVQTLLPIVCFRIAEPLSRLLGCLVLLHAAQHHFADQRLLQTMIDNVSAQATGKHASEQLALAVYHATSQQATQLSSEANRMLAMALTAKLNSGAPQFVNLGGVASSSATLTASYLQESLHMLEHYRPLQAVF